MSWPPTVADRLDRIERAITLVSAAATGKLPVKDDPSHRKIFRRAIQEAASEALEEAYWIRQAGDEVVKAIAPTDDDRDQLKRMEA